VSSADLATERGEIVTELRLGDKFLVTTHENPDGDALGSLLAMHEILKLMGKDSVMFMSSNDMPLPYEYRHLPLDELVHEIPADADERTILFLDCGNIDRMPVNFFQREDVHILNIDHHHDNTRFGTANLVVGHASSTAEIIYSLLDDLEVELTPRIADALYVALVTDTGRFQYENTTAAAHRMAAELIEAGVDVHTLFRQLYENVPFGKVQLLGFVLSRIERFDDGRLTASFITRKDYEAAGSDESFSEGIVDHIRALDGTLVAALIREQLKPEREGIRKVSLRAANDSVDVSVIARKEGGGGHRQAAGFSTEKTTEELISFLRAEIAAQAGAVSAAPGSD
jgi:bifunctional oligoribonuclease and PAP phosphatase NrnA